MAIIENGAQRTHTLPLTLMKTEQTVSIPLKTQVSITACTFVFYSVYLCNIFLQFLLSLVITGLIECVVNTCGFFCFVFLTRGTLACTSRSASCLINSVVKSSCPHLSCLCSSGMSACFFPKSSKKINAFKHAISRKW